MDALKIAVYDHTRDILLLRVEGIRVREWVPWKTFITFVRYLYTMGCDGMLMCETALIDTMQGVIVKYARDRIRLTVRDVNTDGGVKEIWLWTEQKGLPYVNVIDAYRVKTQTAEGGGWHWLCTTREGAIKCGYVVDARGDEHVAEPGGAGDEGASGEAPGGHVDVLMRLDRKLLQFVACI